ncbi:MAG: hypothetical protein AAB229_03595 [Candidatus Hydrogenedentota bacterium]
MTSYCRTGYVKEFLGKTIMEAAVNARDARRKMLQNAPVDDLKQRASELVREDEAFAEKLRGKKLSEKDMRRILTEVETAAILAAGKIKSGKGALERLVKQVRILKKKALL